MKRLISLFIMAILSFPGAPRAAENPVEIVATFSILADMAQQIGGERVHVTALVGADGDAHTYKPSPRDSKALAAADMVLVNGLGFEAWIDRLVRASGSRGTLVTASLGVNPREMEEEGHKGKVTDPHAWQDISNARLYAKNITEALVKLRPADAAYFTARAKAYDSELAQLDIWVRSQIATIPVEHRKIVTSHDAFGYFGTAYSVTFLAPQGLSTEVEPTATQVAKLINQMKAEKVKRVFFETMASPKLVRQLGKDAGISVGVAVYSDALSTPQGAAPTYTALMRHNVTQFKEAMAQNGQ